MTFADLLKALGDRPADQKLAPFAVPQADWDAIRAECAKEWGERLIFASHLVSEPNFVVNGGTPIVVEKPK